MFVFLFFENLIRYLVAFEVIFCLDEGEGLFRLGVAMEMVNVFFHFFDLLVDFTANYFFVFDSFEASTLADVQFKFFSAVFRRCWRECLRFLEYFAEVIAEMCTLFEKFLVVLLLNERLGLQLDDLKSLM